MTHADTAAGALREMWVDISLWFATRFSAGFVVLLTFIFLGNFFGWCMLYVVRGIRFMRGNGWPWGHDNPKETMRARRNGEFSTIMGWMRRGAMSESCTHIVAQCFKILFYLIGIIVALNYWGLPVTPLLLSAGILGFCVSIALKDPLSGLFSGIIIMIYDRLHDGTLVRIQLPGGDTKRWYKILSISLSKVEMRAWSESGAAEHDEKTVWYVPPVAFTSTPYEVKLSDEDFKGTSSVGHAHDEDSHAPTSQLRSRTQLHL